MKSKETKIALTQATSQLWKFWDWLIVLVAVFRSVEVPAIVALKFFQSAPLLVLTINLTTSLLLLFDILLRFQRPVSTARGTLYGKQARLHYLKTYFFLDLIGSLPWGLIGNHLLPEGIWSEPISFLCLFRLARVVVFSQDFVRTPSRFFIAR